MCGDHEYTASSNLLILGSSVNEYALLPQASLLLFALPLLM